MTLVAETGEVVEGAESYCSVSFADSYHSARGSAAWAALDTTAKEQALRKATDYMGQAYRFSWDGFRSSSIQALDWPRTNVPARDAMWGGRIPELVASNIVPDEVKKACAELALRASSGELFADMIQGKKKVRVGPVETEYDEYSFQGKRYVSITSMLTPYFKRGGAIAVVRS